MTSVTVGKVTQNPQVAAKALASQPTPSKNKPVTISGPATKQAQLTTGRQSSPAQPTSAAPKQIVEITVTQPWNYAPSAGSYIIQNRGKGTPGKLLSYTPAKKGQENQITTTTIYPSQGQPVTTNTGQDSTRENIMRSESGYAARINEFGKSFEQRAALSINIKEIGMNVIIPYGNVVGTLMWAGSEVGGGTIAAARQSLEGINIAGWSTKPSTTFYSINPVTQKTNFKMSVSPIGPLENPMPHYLLGTGTDWTKSTAETGAFFTQRTQVITPRMQEEQWIGAGKALGSIAGFVVTPTITTQISKFTRTTEVERLASANTKTGTAQWQSEETAYISPEGKTILPEMKGTGTVSDFTRTTYMEKQSITGISGSTKPVSRLITPVEIGKNGPVKSIGLNINEGTSISYESALTKGGKAQSLGLNIGDERYALFTQKGETAARQFGLYKTDIIAAGKGSQISTLTGKAISTDYPTGITLKDITKFTQKGGAGAATGTSSGTGITQQMTRQMLQQSTSQIPTVTTQATTASFIPSVPTGLTTTKTASLTTLQSGTKTAQLSSTRTTFTTTISLPKTEQIIKPMQGTGTSQIPTAATFQPSGTRTIQIQQPTTSTTQITRMTTIQTPVTTTITTTVQMPPNTGITRTITPWTPPTIPWLPSGSLGGGGGLSLKGIGNIFGKQKTKYQPSISAKILNIRAYKQPRIITGVNIRPIIIKRR